MSSTRPTFAAPTPSTSFQAVAKAKSELPALKAKVDEERKKLEEELEQERKAGK